MFNHDGTFLGKSEYPQRVDELLDKIYGPLQDTQVGALLWCVGAEQARWPSDNLESVVDPRERPYGSVKEFRRAESVRAMFDRGEDLYGDIVRRGHDLGMDVYVAIRMNDNHFWSDSARRAFPLAPEEMARTVRPELTQFRKDHPEWVLGIGNAPRWAVTSWNMAIPEVREYALLRIREACMLADWDGVEIDWQRHAFHLPESDAYRLRYALTDLMRSIRRLADDIAQERGRPFYILTRVGASEETNRRIGYDVGTWIEEGLTDILATNSNSGNDPGVEVERYVEMMEGTNTKLYPGFDSHGEFGRGHLVEQSRWREAWVRGLAKSYYDRGSVRRPRFQLAQLRGGFEWPSHHHRLARYPHRRGHGVHAGQASYPRPSGDTLWGRARRPFAWRDPCAPLPHPHGRRPDLPHPRPRRRCRGHEHRASA